MFRPHPSKPGRRAFSLSKCRAGSDQYGPCECCGKNADTMYLLSTWQTFPSAAGGEGLALLGQRFGHHDCLATITEPDINTADILDYFEHPVAMPIQLQQITESFAARDDDDPYQVCKEFLREVEAIGWTFDYGLEGVPYGLRPMK